MAAVCGCALSSKESRVRRELRGIVRGLLIAAKHASVKCIRVQNCAQLITTHASILPGNSATFFIRSVQCGASIHVLLVAHFVSASLLVAPD